MAEAALPENRREIQIKNKINKCQKECILLEMGAEKLLKMHLSGWRNNIKNFIIIVYSSG